MVVVSATTKIVIQNISKTYEKLHCKAEPYNFMQLAISFETDTDPVTFQLGYLITG